MSDNVYVNNDLQLTLETNTNISGASAYFIKYTKPDSVTGTWTGSLVGTTQITYQADNTDIDVFGDWLFKAYVTYAAGQVYQGDPVYLEIRSTWQTR